MVVSNAVLRLLVLGSATRPLLLIVDDLQWVDRASAAVLSFVARRLNVGNVAFLGAAQPEGDNPFERPAFRNSRCIRWTKTPRRSSWRDGFPRSHLRSGTGYSPKPRGTHWRCSSFRWRSAIPNEPPRGRCQECFL